MKAIIAGALILFLAVSMATAEVYKWVDEKGTVHFTEDSGTIPEKYRDKANSRPTDEEISKPQAVKKGPSIEEVYTFPEKYVKQNLMFSGCKVHQEVTKADDICKDCYSIAITSNGGKYVGAISRGSRGGFTFVLFKELVEKMVGDFEGGYVWSYCNVYCYLLARRDYYVAVILRIDVFNQGGNRSKTYSIKRSEIQP